LFRRDAILFQTAAAIDLTDLSGCGKQHTSRL
jgi:hypothetical protein